MTLGMDVGLSPGDFLLDGDPAPLPKKEAESPNFRPMWPNGWMDQDGTRHGGRPWSSPHCARWGPSPAPQKGAEPPIFGPCLLRWNGCMDQDATWYGPSPLSQKGRSPQFLAHVYCGQTAAWIKMPLDAEVGLGLRNIVLDGDPAPLP